MPKTDPIIERAVERLRTLYHDTELAMLQLEPETFDEFWPRFWRKVGPQTRTILTDLRRGVTRDVRLDAAKVCDLVADEFRHGRTTPKWTAQEAAKRLRALAEEE